jgi:hypothetical protein
MALEEADKEEILKMIGSSLAGALASEDFAKNVGKAVKGQVDAATKDLKAKLAKQPKLEPEPEPDDEEDDDADPEPEPEPKRKSGKAPKASESADFRRMKKQFEDAQKEIREAREAQKLEAQQRKQDALNVSVRDALIAAGVDPKRVGIAMNHITASGIIKDNEDGHPGFAFRDGFGEEIKPINEGAKQWLASEEGKFFVPPVTGSGTGTGVGGTGGKSGSNASAMALLGKAAGDLLR